jgi:poly(A) polymerase
MLISLPDWIYKELLYLGPILDTIGEWRLVGGAVRDIILGRSVKDVDIAIAASPDKVLKLLNDSEIKSVSTGIKYGTVIAILRGGCGFEITSLRRDINCFGRHAEVAYTDDWTEDAARRDFTINALYLNSKKQLYDYFDGLKHLKEKKLVFVGDPENRIKEDHLRVLRYWRFLGLLGIQNIEPESYRAAVGLAYLLKSVSAERIMSEMFKLLVQPHALTVLGLMLDARIVHYIGLNINSLPKGLTEDSLLNLAILLRRQDGLRTEDIDNISDKWRLSNIQRKMLISLCLPKIAIDWSESEMQHKKYNYILGDNTYNCLQAMAKAEGSISSNHINIKSNGFKYEMPLNGEDLKFLKGPQIGHALKEAEEYWLKKDFTPDKNDLLKFVKGISS